nr:MAG TPA: hypothetical protein [Caudoviricetes sp.]
MDSNVSEKPTFPSAPNERSRLPGWLAANNAEAPTVTVGASFVSSRALRHR